MFECQWFGEDRMALANHTDQIFIIEWLAVKPCRQPLERAYCQIRATLGN